MYSVRETPIPTNQLTVSLTFDPNFIFITLLFRLPFVLPGLAHPLIQELNQVRDIQDFKGLAEYLFALL